MTRRSAGFTLIEVTIAVALGGVVLFAATALSRTSLRDGSAIACRTAVETKVADAAETIVRDLQVAGLHGEDADADGALGAQEDTNRNGRLDADWDLADGASADHATFNIVHRGWMWSGPVAYSLTADGVVVRTEDGATREICRNVQALTFTRTGDMIDVVLVAAAKDATAASWSSTARRKVHVRN